MLKYYIFLVINLILHEIGHFLALKIFKINIEYIVIGNGLYLKIKKIKISPIILTCHIEFLIKEYKKLNLIKRLIIIISGPLVNFIIFVSLPNEYIVYKYISLLIFLNSLIPIPFFNTDGMNIFKEIFKSKK